MKIEPMWVVSSSELVYKNSPASSKSLSLLKSHQIAADIFGLILLVLRVNGNELFLYSVVVFAPLAAELEYPLKVQVLVLSKEFTAKLLM